MTPRFRPIQLIGLTVLAALAFHRPARSAGDPLEQALQAAFRPSDIAGLNLFTPTFEIDGHRIGVAPLTVVETGADTYVLSGMLTYQAEAGSSRESLVFRVDKKRGGTPVIRAEYRLGKGAWTPLSAPLQDALTRFRTGRTLTPEQQQEERRRFDAATTLSLDGTSRRAAEFLIARIALGDGC